MDWQLVASYFTVKSTDIFCSAFNIIFRIQRLERNCVDPEKSAHNELHHHLHMSCLQIQLQCSFIQSNFNGSNTFGTMKISSRQGEFEPMRVVYSVRSGGLIVISF